MMGPVLVLAPVSSMKTSRVEQTRAAPRTRPAVAPSRRGAPARRHAPSFFQRDAAAVEGLLQSVLTATRKPLAPQGLAQLGQRRVRRLRHPRQQEGGFGLDAIRPAIATLGLRRRAAACWWQERTSRRRLRPVRIDRLLTLERSKPPLILRLHCPPLLGSVCWGFHRVLRMVAAA